jgi:hypothetical protein
MKANQAVYTSIKGVEKSGYQITAHSGLSPSMLDTISEHSSLRRQLPPGYEFVNALSVQRLDAQTIGITYMFNAGIDFAGRPNRVFSHTICLTDSDYKSIGYDPFLFEDLLFKDEDSYNSSRKPDAAVGSQALSSIDISSIASDGAFLSKLSQAEISEIADHIDSTIENFNLNGKIISDIIQSIIDGEKILIVLRDDQDAIEFVRILKYLLPSPIRSDFFPMTLSMDLEFLRMHHNVMIIPESWYTRAIVGGLPEGLIQYDLRKSSKEVEVSGNTYAQRIGSIIFHIPSKALEFVRNVESDILMASKEHSTKEVLKGFMKADMYIEKAKEIQDADAQIASGYYLQASKVLFDISPHRAQETLESTIDTSLSGNVANDYLEAAGMMLKLLSKGEPRKYLFQAQIMFQDVASSFRTAIPAYLRAALQNVPGNNLETKKTLCLDSIAETEYTLEKDETEQMITEFHQSLGATDMLDLCKDVVKEGDPSGAFAEPMRTWWRKTAFEKNDLTTILEIASLVPKENQEELSSIYDDAIDLASELSGFEQASTLCISRIDLGMISERGGMKKILKFQKKVVHDGYGEDVDKYVLPVAHKLAQGGFSKEYEEFTISLLDNLDGRKWHEKVLNYGVSFAKDGSQIGVNIEEIVAKVVSSLPKSVDPGSTPSDEIVKDFVYLSDFVDKWGSKLGTQVERIVDILIDVASDWLGRENGPIEPFTSAIGVYVKYNSQKDAIEKVRGNAEALSEAEEYQSQLRLLEETYKVLPDLDKNAKEALLNDMARNLSSHPELSSERFLSWLKSEASQYGGLALNLLVRVSMYSYQMKQVGPAKALSHLQTLLRYVDEVRTQADDRLLDYIRRLPGNIVQVSLKYSTSDDKYADTKVIVEQLTENVLSGDRENFPGFVADVIENVSDSWKDESIVKWTSECIEKAGEDAALLDSILSTMSGIMEERIKEKDARAALQFLSIISANKGDEEQRSRAIRDISGVLSGEKVDPLSASERLEELYLLAKGNESLIQRDKKTVKNIESTLENVEDALGLDNISDSDFAKDARIRMAVLDDEEFSSWALSKLGEDLSTTAATALGKIIIDKIDTAIYESNFSSIAYDLDILDYAFIVEPEISASVDLAGVYAKVMKMTQEQLIPPQEIESMVNEMCSDILEFEDTDILKLGQQIAKQKQALMATLFLRLYNQDPEAFIRQIDKAPEAMAILIGDAETAKWLVKIYSLVYKENTTVGKHILEVMFTEAERLAKVPDLEGFNAYLHPLLNTKDAKRLSNLLITIIDRLQKNNKGYEVLQFLMKKEPYVGYIPDEDRYKLIKKSFEDVSNASIDNVDDFSKLIIQLEKVYSSLALEIKGGDERVLAIILDLGVQLVKSISSLMEQLSKDADDKDKELVELYGKAQYLLNSIVRVFRAYSNKKMAERLRDRFKGFPKGKNRDLWIKTGESIVDEKKEA